MHNLRGTYVHRGDSARRRRRLGQVLLGLGFLAAAVAAWTYRKPSPALAAPTESEGGSSFFARRSDIRKIRNELESTRGELDLLQSQFDRANHIIAFSGRYGISADLSSLVFDASISEGIDPELAFRVVRLESQFNEHALSSSGAVGLLQVMPSTARQFDRALTKDGLYARATNLHIGLKYLRRLLALYHGNVHLAVLAYNRGEDAVSRDVRNGVNPTNGYDTSVLRGYQGKGIIDEAGGDVRTSPISSAAPGSGRGK
jgi:soluble lytic murein transglycosylase-like protein